MAPSIDKHLDLSPPPLPTETLRTTPERRRLRTETSATSGWAARLALLMHDKSKSVTAR